MKAIRIISALSTTVLLGSLFATPALAEAVNGGIGFQEAVTDSAVRIHDFHNLLLYIISAITAFVFLLLVYVVFRFNDKANPVPSKTTHNVLLEIVWTAIPIIVVVVIAVQSFKLLYVNEHLEKPEMTLKIKGIQWYWNYEYPDHEGLAFDALLVPEAELKEGQKRLLSTDNVVVLPIETNIAILVTAPSDGVIHAWTVPAFGVKVDAVPGRTNEAWFRIEKPGVYYGQCSEICGKDHAFMPIEVHAVSKADFAAWVEKAKVDFASNDNMMPVQMALIEKQ